MAKYEEWLEEDNLVLLEGWARDGLTDEQIAKNMGITRETLRVWKSKFSAIFDALKKGKAVADYIIENELYKSAQTRILKVKKPIKVKISKKDGQKMITEEKIEYVEEEVVVPANVTAQIFWLKNRKPEVWREKQEVIQKVEFEDDGFLEALRVNVDIDMKDDSDMIADGDE